MLNGFTDMIEGSLNLKAPWYVEWAEFLPEKQEVHIYVNAEKMRSFLAPYVAQQCESATSRTSVSDGMVSA